MSTLTENSYRGVKIEIVNRIRSGQWSVGDKIPGEEELAQEFGCARTTVNRALRELAADGIVERRRKGGTQIIAGMRLAAQIKIPLVREEIEATGADYTYQLISRQLITPPPIVQQHLNLTQSDKALHLQCLHFADNRLHQLEDRWINPITVPTACAQTFDAISPNEWLVREIPLTDAEHVFLAHNVDPENAKLMGLKARDAVFIIERKTWLDTQSLTWVRLLHPGSTFRMVSHGPRLVT